MMRTSRCSCGECTVVVEGDPGFSVICNCDDCRRRTGSAFNWSVYYHNDKVGEAKGPFATRRVSTPDYPHTRYFCSQCGSTLYWNSDTTRPHLTGFAAGCFNDPTLPAPTRVVRYAQRMPWAVFPSACEIFDG